MVKGVSRNIIEVNNTGSDCFERIVFYISPDFPVSGKNVADLAASELEKILGGFSDYKGSLRYRIKVKKRRKTLAILITSLLILSALITGIIIRK